MFGVVVDCEEFCVAVDYDVWVFVYGDEDYAGEDWEEPYLSIPAGEDAYIYRDEDLVVGETYEYGLAAQDCTPTLSNMTAAPPVVIPIT